MLRSIVPERIRDMGKIFHEYGGTIITVIAVVLLISFVTTAMNTGGVLYNAFGSMIDGLSEKAKGMVNGDDTLVLEVKDGKVPDGWAYSSASSGEVLSAGSKLPDTLMAGDTLTQENGDYVYSLMKDGFATLEEARTYYRSYMENQTRMTWDEILAALTEEGIASEEEAWAELGESLEIGLTEETFVPAASEPYWAVNVKERTKTSYANDIYGELLDIPVTSMYNAFAECTNLVDASNIVIPSSVTDMEDAFTGCTALTKAPAVRGNFPHVFQSCESLTSVTIGNGVTNISEYAFNGCISLTSVTIGDRITNIGDRAFSGCTSLMSVTIPDSVTSIGSGAFCDCTSLTSVKIGDGVTSIGTTPFYNCTSLTNISVSSSNTTYHSAGNCLIETVSKSVVAGCKGSVIPSDGSVTHIDADAFSGCLSLVSITIPGSVTSIDDSTFSSCESLTSVIIGDGVTSIGELAFYACTSLTSIEFEGSIEQWNTIMKGKNWNYYVPATEVVCSDGVVSLVDG